MFALQVCAARLLSVGFGDGVWAVVNEWVSEAVWIGWRVRCCGEMASGVCCWDVQKGIKLTYAMTERTGLSLDVRVL